MIDFVLELLGYRAARVAAGLLYVAWVLFLSLYTWSAASSFIRDNEEEARELFQSDRVAVKPVSLYVVLNHLFRMLWLRWMITAVVGVVLAYAFTLEPLLRDRSSLQVPNEAFERRIEEVDRGTAAEESKPFTLQDRVRVLQENSRQSNEAAKEAFKKLDDK